MDTTIAVYLLSAFLSVAAAVPALYLAWVCERLAPGWGDLGQLIGFLGGLARRLPGLDLRSGGSAGPHGRDGTCLPAGGHVGSAERLAPAGSKFQREARTMAEDWTGTARELGDLTAR